MLLSQHRTAVERSECIIHKVKLTPNIFDLEFALGVVFCQVDFWGLYFNEFDS